MNRALQVLFLVVMVSISVYPSEGRCETALWKVWEGSLNINEASEAEFALLEGVGSVTAYRIVEYRKKAGGFKSLAQLKEVEGISNAGFRRLERNLTLFGNSDLRVLVDINRAPISALVALPRVSRAIALAIVEYREKNDGFDDLSELLQVPGINRVELDELRSFVTVRPLEIIVRQ